MNVGRYLRGEDRHVGTARTTQPQQPQRTWIGLTDEEKNSFWKADQMTQEEWDKLFNAIEAKLKDKNVQR